MGYLMRFEPTEYSTSTLSEAEVEEAWRDANREPMYGAPFGLSGDSTQFRTNRRKKVRSIDPLQAKVAKYGITGAEYRLRLRKQRGVCAICQEKCKTGWRLGVDHCHTSGQVRGLLCGKCNSGLGMFKDDPERLIQAIGYLLRPEH